MEHVRGEGGREDAEFLWEVRLTCIPGAIAGTHSFDIEMGMAQGMVELTLPQPPAHGSSRFQSVLHVLLLVQTQCGLCRIPALAKRGGVRRVTARRVRAPVVWVCIWVGWWISYEHPVIHKTGPPRPWSFFMFSHLPANAMGRENKDVVR